ncbi:hypothetical protein MKX07_005986 [Trichoderma sp. CBMAI-0711]|nr:hypothetical protein MKX07_005986 [Trichoderma sp. CBMAI-0711]
MNRPRNRQPRPPGQTQRPGGRSSHLGRRAPGTPQQAAGTVPTSRQVVAGAAVFIVLKEDQPTGRETQGIVQDVLTSGDHPRGIKVRLRSGQVGRVQRLDDGSSQPSNRTALASGASFNANSKLNSRYTDIRNDADFDNYLQGPPPRSLADFMPSLEPPTTIDDPDDAGGAPLDEGTAVCPIFDLPITISSHSSHSLKTMKMQSGDILRLSLVM